MAAPGYWNLEPWNIAATLPQINKYLPLHSKHVPVVQVLTTVKYLQTIIKIIVDYIPDKYLVLSIKTLCTVFINH